VEKVVTSLFKGGKEKHKQLLMLEH